MRYLILAYVIVCAACSKDSNDKPGVPAQVAKPPGDACAALVAEVTKTEAWPPIVEQIAGIGAPCAAHIDPVIDVMVAAMDARKYEPAHFEATKKLLDAIKLTPAQNDKIMAANQRLQQTATGAAQAEVENVARKCIKNREGNLQPPR